MNKTEKYLYEKHNYVGRSIQAHANVTKQAMKDFAEWTQKQGYVFYDNGDGFWVLHADHARKNQLTTDQLLTIYLNKDNDG